MKDVYPTVSVVVPAFNEEKYLPQLFLSLAKQTVLPFEIIVANNNSTDKTEEIARSSGARVVKVTSQGYVFALSDGMSEARGDIIAVIDADTQADPAWIETVALRFQDESVVGATGAIQLPGGLVARILDLLFNIFLLVHFSLGLPHLIGFNMAVRRTTLQKIKGVDLAFTMSPDVDLGLRLKKHGKVVYEKKMVVVPSTRRWDKGIYSTFKEYALGYFSTVWLRRPPKVQQTVIR